jgi:uncharacterized membrane protein
MPSAALSRLIRHLLHTPINTRRTFPVAVQEAMRWAVANGEQRHRGEIRFVVEGDWPLAEVLGKKTLRERALEIFGLSRVWDTEENTGLLIYVLLCEHRVEIVADRGLHRAVGNVAWESICAGMTEAFRAGAFAAGSVAAIEAVNALLQEHFPAGRDGNPNELPDMPILLR